MFFGDDKYLPYAVEGFFLNGGKRGYVARIVDRQAAGDCKDYGRFDHHLGRR